MRITSSNHSNATYAKRHSNAKEGYGSTKRKFMDQETTSATFAAFDLRCGTKPNRSLVLQFHIISLSNYSDELARHVQRHTRNRDRKEDFRPLHLMNRKETSEIMNEDIKKEPTEEERDSQDDTSSSLQTDQKSTASLTECEKCQKVFQSQKSLWLHYKFAHKPKNLKCSVCNVVFVSK